MRGDIPAFTADEVLNGIYFIHTSERRKKAREVDEAMSSRETHNPWQWLDDPNRYDWMGIDTIEKQKPSGYTKEKGRMAAKKMKKVQHGLW